MAAKKPNANAAALAADEGAAIPRISLQEQGFTGLKHINGIIIEDTNRAFRYPSFLKVVAEAKNDAVLASAMNVYRMFLSRVKWKVVPPEDATPVQIERARFVESLMYDMEHDWGSFIEDVTEYLWYGFSIVEKVYRRRLRKNGSLHNDGLVGLKKLAPRGQDTIRYWRWTDDGRELVKVEQSLRNLENGYKYVDVATNPHGLVDLYRDKFLLFTCDSNKDNPQGNSLLKGVYLIWKQMCLVRDQELLSIAKDAAGLPLIKIPAKYMDPNASDADKAVYQTFTTILNNLSAGTQRGIIIPKMVDPETKSDMFTVELLEKKAMNVGVDVVIKRCEDAILRALSVDVLQNSNQGSFSLQDGDTNVLSIALSHRLNEIAAVLNTDLVRQVFKLNGWLDEKLPRFVPEDVCSQSLEELSKFVQRTGSIGLIAKDLPTVNKIRKAMGVEELPDDTNLDDVEFTMESSNAGKGMTTPFDGTAKQPSGKDSSTANNENAS